MKYIIDIPSELLIKDDGYSFSDGKSYCITGNLSKLTPYTELDHKTIEDEVWSLARIIETMSVGEVMNIFGVQAETVPFLCNALKYQEAKSKYEAWLKRNDEINVGDEVTYTLCGDRATFIVLGKKKNKYYGFIPNAPDYDEVGEYCDADMLKKTGRHFPEVVELLEKMKGEEGGQ